MEILDQHNGSFPAEGIQLRPRLQRRRQHLHLPIASVHRYAATSSSHGGFPNIDFAAIGMELREG